MILLGQNLFSQVLNEQYVEAKYHNEEGKIKNNDMASFRIIKEIKLNNITIPENTFFYATAQFSEGRVKFEVDKIKVGETIYPVKVRIVASDLKDGLPYDTKKNWIYMYRGSYKFIFQEL
jgi:hypothetical protein